MTSSRALPVKLVIAVGFLFTISVCPTSKAAKKSTSSNSGRLERSLDDELVNRRIIQARLNVLNSFSLFPYPDSDLRVCPSEPRLDSSVLGSGYQLSNVSRSVWN